MSLDIDKVRSHFPSLASGYIFADNAGGSQVISDVIARISDYLINTNVQLGADYSVGQKSTRRVADGAVTAKELFNSNSADEVAIAASSTLLMDHLTRALESNIKEGDEFIITGEHECTLLFSALLIFLSSLIMYLSKCWTMEEIGSSQRLRNQILEP
jgi:selenocysteine lyase/cysteine desulfurase